MTQIAAIKEGTSSIPDQRVILPWRACHF